MTTIFCHDKEPEVSQSYISRILFHVFIFVQIYRWKPYWSTERQTIQASKVTRLEEH
jgi:hypothetical protein